MSGWADEPGADGPATEMGDEGDPLTVVAEPAVIDLRDGVDTIAAHEADRARRAELAARRPR